MLMAEKFGNDSEASFSRAFKRIMGAPTSQFRKQESAAAFAGVAAE